jgi:hypothetical protein
MLGMHFLFPASYLRSACLLVGLCCHNDLYFFSFFSSLPSATGAVEWANTLAVFMYVVSFINEFLPDVHVGVFDVSSQQDKRTVLLSIGNHRLTQLSLGVLCGTVGIGFALFARLLGGQYLPEVSDLFVLPPGNR